MRIEQNERCGTGNVAIGIRKAWDVIAAAQPEPVDDDSCEPDEEEWIFGRLETMPLQPATLVNQLDGAMGVFLLDDGVVVLADIEDREAYRRKGAPPRRDESIGGYRLDNNWAVPGYMASKAREHAAVHCIPPMTPEEAARLEWGWRDEWDWEEELNVDAQAESVWREAGEC